MKDDWSDILFYLFWPFMIAWTVMNPPHADPPPPHYDRLK